MPMQSEAQRRAMYAAKAGKGTVGIPMDVAGEFLASDKGGKLPRYAAQSKEKVRRKAFAGAKRGK